MSIWFIIFDIHPDQVFCRGLPRNVKRVEWRKRERAPAAFDAISKLTNEKSITAAHITYININMVCGKEEEREAN